MEALTARVSGLPSGPALVAALKGLPSEHAEAVASAVVAVLAEASAGAYVFCSFSSSHAAGAGQNHLATAPWCARCMAP